jgi:hypothetical protein
VQVHPAALEFDLIDLALRVGLAARLEGFVNRSAETMGRPPDAAGLSRPVVVLIVVLV